MGVRNENSTDYVHPDEPNLLNLHKAMQYNTGGEPVIRTHVDGITLEGNVIVDAVKIWDGVHTLSFDQPNNDGEPGQYSLPAENYNMVYNGSTWDRMRGNISNGVLTYITNPSLSVIANVTALPSITGNVNANVTGNVGITSLPNIAGNVNVSGNVGILTIPNVNASVTGNIIVSSGNVNASVTGNVVVSGNVNANVTGNVIVSSGNIDANVHGNVGILGNVNVTQGTSPWVVSGNVTISQNANVPALVKYIDRTNTQLDMTERLRVAPPTQSWWYAPSVDKDGDLRYIESATGTGCQSLFIQNLATIWASSGTDSNGSFIRISRRRHKMRPGVSMQYKASMSFHGKRTNVTKRAGMFTNFNGIFYEVTDDLYIVVRRRLTDGTLIEKRVARTLFSEDKLDGTGPTGFDFTSSKTLNITSYVSKSTVTVNSVTGSYIYNVVFNCGDTSTFDVGTRIGISGITPKTYNTSVMIVAKTSNTVTVSYVVDPGSYTSMSSATGVQTAFHMQYVYGFEFAGSRTTMIRFFMEGTHGLIPIHIEDFTGTLGTTFENAPAISTRYEIFNTGTTVGQAAMSVSSEVVNVEAEVELNPGFGTAYNNTGVPYSKLATEEYAILGIGLRAGEPYQRADLQLQTIQITDTHNINPQNSGVMFFRLLLNPTIGGTVPTPSNIGKASRYWRYTTATTFSGGTELYSGYVTQAIPIDIKQALNFINLGSNITYDDADKIVLVVKMLAGGSADSLVVANMNFIESL